MAIYVNNKTLLQEIQKSKMTFCAYFEEWHTNQIVYTTDLSTLTDEDIEEARLHYNGKRSTEEPVNLFPVFFNFSKWHYKNIKCITNQFVFFY